MVLGWLPGENVANLALTDIVVCNAEGSGSGPALIAEDSNPQSPARGQQRRVELHPIRAQPEVSVSPAISQASSTSDPDQDDGCDHQRVAYPSHSAMDPDPHVLYSRVTAADRETELVPVDFGVTVEDGVTCVLSTAGKWRS